MTGPRNGIDPSVVELLAAAWTDPTSVDDVPPGTPKRVRQVIVAARTASGDERHAAMRRAGMTAEEAASMAAFLAAAEGLPVPTRRSDEPAGLNFVRACDVQREAVEWLWEGRLARGKITMLEGDPGTGKTTLAMSVAAAISNGTPLPCQGSRPTTAQSVIVFSGEDGLGDTLRPRLEAAGADLARVHFEDLSSPTSLRLALPRDVELLEAKVLELGAGLVIIDPVLSYLDADIDSHKDQSVRQALMPLAAMAQRTRVAIILIRHLNKSGGQSAIYRGGGSIAFAGIARLVLLAAKDPDDGNAYVLARTKGSLGRPPPALCYSLDSSSNGSSEVRWGGVSTHTADDLLAPPPRGPKPETLDQATAYLRDLLAAGPRPRQEVMEMAAKVNLSERTMDRAREALGVQSTREGATDPKERLWRLP